MSESSAICPNCYRENRLVAWPDGARMICLCGYSFQPTGNTANAVREWMAGGAT